MSKKKKVVYRITEFTFSPTESQKQMGQYKFMDGLIDAILDAISKYYYDKAESPYDLFKQNQADQLFEADYQKWAGVQEALDDLRKSCKEEKIIMKEMPLGNIIIDALFSYFDKGRYYDNDHGFFEGRKYQKVTEPQRSKKKKTKGGK